MELKGSKTEEHLQKAFNRELHVQARYLYYASVAKEAGLEQAGDIFLVIAENEAEHARHEFKFLGGAGDTGTSLNQAITFEQEDASKLYPRAAEVAEQEGFREIAEFFRRMAKVEAKHEKNFTELQESLAKGKDFPGRTVGHSAIEMAQLMLPHQANPAGFVHGGEMMKLMDNAAGVVAVRHCRTNVVTATVEDIRFRSPVHVGDLVIVRGKLIFVSRSSMEVQIEVETENLLTGQRFPALTAHFVMVALDMVGKTVAVPPLILMTEEEERLHSEASARYETRKAKSERSFSS
jgi:acyl-CoA hydrolase/ferritin